MKVGRLTSKQSITHLSWLILDGYVYCWSSA